MALGPNIRRFNSPDTCSSRVAELFAFQPLPADVPEQIVGGVGGHAAALAAEVGIDEGRLAIGGREDHQPLNRFQMPAIGDELGGEPIEQFGMRRVAAHRAEIVRRGDDALAEVILPEAIDDDAGRERIDRGG